MRLLGTNPDAFGIWTLEDRQRFPWWQWLDAVRDTGYHQVELGSPGYLPAGTQARDELAARGLTATAGYLGRVGPDPAAREALTAALRRVAADVVAAGGSHVLAIPAFYRDVAGVDQGPRHFSGGQWASLSGLLNDLAAVATDEFGLGLAVHAHWDTAVETEAHVDRLLTSTQDGVGLCLDTGQLGYRGVDPVILLRRWAARVNYVHVRDLAPEVTARCRDEDTPFEAAVRRGVFCDPGEGLMDFEGFTAALDDVGYQGPVVVERSLLGASQAEARATAARAARYYERIGLVAAGQS
jgi:inosose dehydratase